DDADRSLGHPAEYRDDRAANPPEPARKEACDLVSLHVRLPVAEHLGAEEGPATQLLHQCGELGVVRLRRDRAERLAFRGGVLDIVRDPPQERAEPGESALERPSRESEPALAISGELVDALEHGRRRLELEALARRIEPTLGDADDLNTRVVDPPERRVLQNAAEV